MQKELYIKEHYVKKQEKSTFQSEVSFLMALATFLTCRETTLGMSKSSMIHQTRHIYRGKFVCGIISKCIKQTVSGIIHRRLKPNCEPECYHLNDIKYSFIYNLDKLNTPMVSIVLSEINLI